MKKQFLLIQICGLAIGVAGALAPFGSALAADKPMAPESFQRDQPVELYMGEIKTEPRGAQGPIRDDTATVADKSVTKETFQSDVPLELYSP